MTEALQGVNADPQSTILRIHAEASEEKPKVQLLGFLI